MPTDPRPHGRVAAEEIESLASSLAARHGNDDFEADADYFELVRLALGRGAPTVLVGTSERSLDRAVEHLALALQGKPEEAEASRMEVERRIEIDILVPLTIVLVVAGVLLQSTPKIPGSGIVGVIFAFSALALVVFLHRHSLRGFIDDIADWRDDRKESRRRDGKDG